MRLAHTRCVSLCANLLSVKFHSYTNFTNLRSNSVPCCSPPRK